MTTSPETHDALNELAAAIRARIPSAAEELGRIAQAAVDDGLPAPAIGQFQVEEFHQASMAAMREGAADARATWEAWTALLEDWWARSAELDQALRWLVVVFLPDPDDDDTGLLDGIGPATRQQYEVVQSELRSSPLSPRIAAFVADLVEAHPDLAPLEEEWADDDGVVLAHPFMADVARHVLAAHDRDGQHAAQAHEILGRVERALGQDQDLDNLLVLGFIEGFPEQDAPRPDLVTHFGPRLTEKARMFAPDLFPPN